MGHTFGMFTNSQNKATFGKMSAQFVADSSHPNHPDNVESPNVPRTDRYAGYQNPILGDDGAGKIGRWQQIKLDALENVIEQIIEQYLRDKTWYSKVRCREALWNMYRRLEWWVQQQVDPTKNDYQRALQMIKDCINNILEEAQDPALAHNVSLPLCPAPYYFPFSGDYLNHYDGRDIEVKLFDSRDLPVTGDFPGLFKYVSSAEDQEWKLVHSTGTDEKTGSETIMKLNINTLVYGNSSKITFNWRFKKRGFIRFKYMASVSPGNGLTFFINNNQVGGEWSRSSGWNEVKFNVFPGQTYKFDWLVRRQSEIPFGKNAIYVKDVECIEVIRTAEAPTPPDFDTLGGAAYGDGNYDWITFSKSSVVRTHFDGVVTEDNKERTLSFDIDNECDGNVSFAYRMNKKVPDMRYEYNMFYVDDLLNRIQTRTAPHGSRATKTHDGQWTGDGDSLQTKKGAAKITYDIKVSADAKKVDLSGLLQIICPDRVIDHHVETEVRSLTNTSWSNGGQWDYYGTAKAIFDPKEGEHDLTATVDVPDGGWFVFGFTHDLRPSESFEVLVDGNSVHYSMGVDTRSIKVNLTPGTHVITFKLVDLYTEIPLTDNVQKTYAYGKGSQGDSFTTRTPLGSSATITRNWNVTETGANTFTDGKTIEHVVTLNPGATFTLKEMVTFSPSPTQPESSYTKYFYDDFNDEATAGNQMTISPEWEWEDILTRVNRFSRGDGILKVEQKPGVHSMGTMVNAPRGGYVFFEYGGKFGNYDYVELLAGDTQIWKNNFSSDTNANTVKISIPAGSYELKWVYHCQGGGTVTLPPDPQQPQNPSGEVCYDRGLNTIPINYSVSSHRQTTPRTSRIGWGGDGFYTSSSAHATDRNEATISRTMFAPTFAAISFSEKLSIQPGTNSEDNGWFDIPFDMYPYNQSTNNTMHKGNGYYALHVGGVAPGSSTGWVTGYFSTDGEIRINFEYLSFLKTKEMRTTRFNKSGRSSAYRGEFRVFLVSERDEKNPVQKVQELSNVGTKQMYSNISNWSGAQQVNIKASVPRGRYAVLFTMTDVVNDRDMDDEGYPFYAAFRGLKVKVKESRTDTNWDATKVKVELINRQNNTIEDTRTYSAYSQESVYNIDYYGLRPGTPYEVRYTLLKGKGTSGGLYGNGGTFKVTQGEFTESWIAYCTLNGEYYPKTGTAPQGPNPPTVINVPSTPGAWAWLDAIDIRVSNAVICSDTRVLVRVYDGDNIIINDRYNNYDMEEEIQVQFTNRYRTQQQYRVVQEFRSSCGAGARFEDGQIEINDVKQPADSQITLTAFSVINNRPVWMGGCDGSSVTVTLFNEQNAQVYRQRFTGAGYHPFGVSNLLNQPYSNYRMLIETDQLGYVSPVSGREYMTTFKLEDFRAYEEWENVPDPFNGKLEFYIDNQLVGTYTAAGGFFTVSYPLAKGQHNLRWVFTELGTGNSYDFCEIDFVKITNWICDKVKVVPYCEEGKGDKCIEELIKCLLKLWNDRPKACVIGKTIWLFT